MILSGAVTVDGQRTQLSASVTVTAPASTPSPIVVGVTRPTRENVGCLTPRMNLDRNETRELVLDVPGKVYENIYLPYGRVTVAAPGVRMRNSRIAIGPAGPDRKPTHGNCGVTIDPNRDGRGAIFEDVTVEPEYAAAATTDHDTTGFFVVNATLRRCLSVGLTDGAVLDVDDPTSLRYASGAGPSLVEACRLEVRWLAWPNAVTLNGTHCDPVQIAGGSGHIIRGCSLVGTPVSKTQTPQHVGQCVVATPYRGAIDDLWLDRNWCENGGSQISAWVPKSYYGGRQPQRLRLTGNRHEGDFLWPVLITPEVQATATITGEVYGPGPANWNNGAGKPGAPAFINVTAAPA